MEVGKRVFLGFAVEVPNLGWHCHFPPIYLVFFLIWHFFSFTRYYEKAVDLNLLRLRPNIKPDGTKAESQPVCF